MNDRRAELEAKIATVRGNEARFVSMRIEETKRRERLESELAALKREPEWTEIGSSLVARRVGIGFDYELATLFDTNADKPIGIDTTTIAALAKFAGLPVLSEKMVEKLVRVSKQLSREWPEHTKGVDDGSSCLAREILADLERKP